MTANAMNFSYLSDFTIIIIVIRQMDLLSYNVIYFYGFHTAPTLAFAKLKMDAFKNNIPHSFDRIRGCLIKMTIIIQLAL